MSVRDLFATIEIESDFRQLTRLDSAMDGIEDSLRGMGRRVDGATDDLNQMGNEGQDAMQDIRRGSERAEEAVDDLGDEFRSTRREGENAASGISSSFKKLVGVLATVFAVDKIKDFGLTLVKNAAEAGASTAQFEQVFKGMEVASEDSLNKIADTTGMLPNRIKGSFTQMAAFAKTTGASTEDALKLSERATLAAADSAAFYDKSIEEVADTMQSYLKGNYENDSALGISSTETTRNAKANELYGKSFKDLSESQKQLSLLSMVEDGNKAAGALGQAAREADSWENQTGNLKQAWKDFTALVGQPLLEPAINAIKRLSSWISGIDTTQLINTFKNVGGYLSDTFGPVVNDIKGFIQALWNEFELNGGVEVAKAGLDGIKGALEWLRDNSSVITAGLAGLAGAFTAFKVISIVNAGMALFNTLLIAQRTGTLSLTLAQMGLNTAMLANPITWVVIAIGALIAIGVLLYKNWDKVKIGASLLWEAIKEAFTKISDWTTEKLAPVRDFFSSLKDRFNDFKNAITSFKVPEWVSKIGGMLSSGASKVGSFLDGSHETGLNNVPFDGYRAELHKGEAVLTAQEAKQWRAGESGATPQINVTPSRGGGTTYSPIVNVTVNGGNGDPNAIAKAAQQAAEQALDKTFRKLTMQQA